MRTMIVSSVAALATSAALLTAVAPASADSADEEAKLTASAKAFCQEDGTTRVRVRVKNASEKLVRTVAYQWQLTGKDARLATTWVDAPDAKRILAVTIPTSGAAKIHVTADAGDGDTLLKRTFRPLDC